MVHNRPTKIVSNLIMFFLLIFMVCSTCYSDNDIKPRTYPLELKEISNITITNSGKTLPAEENTQQHSCDSFELTEKEVEDFFNKTMSVHQSDYHHMLDWSPCYQEGTITFSDDSSAVWAIHQFKAGSIVLDNNETIYMYCPNCQADAFTQE